MGTLGPGGFSPFPTPGLSGFPLPTNNPTRISAFQMLLQRLWPLSSLLRPPSLPNHFQPSLLHPFSCLLQNQGVCFSYSHILTPSSSLTLICFGP